MGSKSLKRDSLEIFKQSLNIIYKTQFLWLLKLHNYF